MHFSKLTVVEKLDAPISDTTIVQKKEIISKTENPIKQPLSVVNGPISKLVTSNNVSRRSSNLSLKSIHKKKEVKKSIIETIENLDDLPKNPFSTEQVQKLWNTYIKKLQKNGEKLLASLMGSCLPIADENDLLIALPNARMKTDLEKAKPKILQFIREELQNYHINFAIQVNEEIEKKFAYTPKEKYEYLREKNALISKLKKKFDLDV